MIHKNKILLHLRSVYNKQNNNRENVEEKDLGEEQAACRPKKSRRMAIYTYGKIY